jgi:hypothetical protein
MTATQPGPAYGPTQHEDHVRLLRAEDVAFKGVSVMMASPRPTPHCISIGGVHPEGWVQRQWRLDALALCRVAAFIVKMLRRPRKRRAFGPAHAEEVG